MTQKISYLFKAFAMTVIIMGLFTGCGSDKPGGNPDNGPVNGEYKVTIPATMDVTKGQVVQFAQEGGAVKASDRILLEKDGKSTPCTITEADDTHFSFRLPQSVETGDYSIYVSAGGKRTLLGKIKFTVVAAQISIPEGATVYGLITDTEGNPLKDVVVSDGKNFAKTGANGVYGLKSDKEFGVVFMSVPSGYEPEANGVFPKMYQNTALSASVPENISFTLKAVDQTNFKVLYLGDQHLAKRTNDMAQYRLFTSDVNNYIAANTATPVYAITLGDMTWDQYWKNGFTLKQYVETANENLKNILIYNCIGNHDHDPNAIGITRAINPMVEYVAPAWYSFNIGQNHFVILDNIDCSAYDGVQDRPYFTNVYDPQLDWLRKDLEFVDKSTPVYVMTHNSQFASSSTPNVFSRRTKNDNGRVNNTADLIACFEGRTVHFVNGHLHQQHTVLPKDTPEKYSFPVYEHNIPAVCGDWWYSGYYTPGCGVSTDGTPYGYAIFDFTGKGVKWDYKGTGMDQKIKFRTYDLNNVNFSNVKWSNHTGAAVINEFKKRYVTNAKYDGSARRNQVLINVWNWNSDWKIEVKTTDGRTLKATQTREYDPLSILALTIPYWDRGVSSIPGTGTSYRFHFFTVDCPDATTDLEITVTDNFGNTYKETMQRPRPFSAAEYSIKK